MNSSSYLRQTHKLIQGLEIESGYRGPHTLETKPNKDIIRKLWNRLSRKQRQTHIHTQDTQIWYKDRWNGLRDRAMTIIFFKVSSTLCLQKKANCLVYWKEGSTAGDVPFWSHVYLLNYTREAMSFFKIHHKTLYWQSLQSCVQSLSVVVEWHELIKSESHTLLGPVLFLPFSWQGGAVKVTLPLWALVSQIK